MIISNMLLMLSSRKRLGMAAWVIAAMVGIGSAEASDLVAVVCTDAGYDRLCGASPVDAAFCSAYNADDMENAVARVRSLRDPQTLLPAAHMAACRLLKDDERDAAKQVLNRAISKTADETSKTKRSKGVLTPIGAVARLQTAAGFVDDTEQTMGLFDRVAGTVAPVEEALLARAVAALDFAAIGEASRADTLLDNAFATLDQVAEMDGDRPARYQAAFVLTQIAAETGRWDRARLYLERLQTEAPIIETLDIPAAERDAIRRSRRWLAGVVDKRVFEAPAN